MVISTFFRTFAPRKRNKIMNALESLIAVLSTPIAKRKGVTISAEDCKVWVEVLSGYEEHIRSELKKQLQLLTIL